MVTNVPSVPCEDSEVTAHAVVRTATGARWKCKSDWAVN